MKLPVNFLLYVSTLGLLGLAGMTFYQAHLAGSRENKEVAHKRGVDAAKDLLAGGRGQSTVAGSWVYAKDPWETAWQGPNLLGKDPPPPPEDPGAAAPVKPVIKVDLTPLEDIIELVTIMFDPDKGNSHVTVRYRENVEVHPPLWWELENEAAAAASLRGGPGDAVGNLRPDPRTQGRGGNRRGGQPPPPPPMPRSTAGREVLQRLWVTGDDSPRFEARLWPPHDHIKLVRIAEDGLSAFFERPGPVPAGQEEPEPRVDELIKSSLPLSQDMLRTLRELGPESRLVQAAENTQPAETQWQAVEETTRINGVWHLGSKDRDAFAGDNNSFLEQINVDSYVSPTGSGQRGLQVMNVSSELQQRFGVQQGELILAVNGTPVTTKAQAINHGKKLYNQGVRRFTVTFLSNGREIERTYQAPDR